MWRHRAKKTWSEGTWLVGSRTRRKRRRKRRQAPGRPQATWAGRGRGAGSDSSPSPAPSRRLSPWGWRGWCAAVCTGVTTWTVRASLPGSPTRCPEPVKIKVRGQDWRSRVQFSRLHSNRDRQVPNAQTNWTGWFWRWLIFSGWRTYRWSETESDLEILLLWSCTIRFVAPGLDSFHHSKCGTGTFWGFGLVLGLKLGVRESWGWVLGLGLGRIRFGLGVMF